MGWDDGNRVWKLYCKRENLQSKPSILGFLWNEMKEIVTFLKTKMSEIEKSIAEGMPLDKPDEDITKVEEPRDLSFWLNPSTFYTESSHARIRALWGFNNKYTYHFQIVNIPGADSKYPTNFGAKASC